MATTVHLRFQTHTWFTAYVQRTNAFRTVGFVRGKAHQINFEFLQINRHFTRGLRRIHMEKHAFVAAQLTNRLDVLNHADFVIDHHHRDQNGVGTNRGFKHVQINQTVFQHIQIGHFKTFTLQFARGIENRFVLGFHRDDVFATVLIKLGDAFEREVVRLGRSGGKHDLARVRIDQCGHLRTRLFDRLFCFPAIRVRARSRVAKMLGNVRNHFLRHTRVSRRGRRVVHINRHDFCIHKQLPSLSRYIVVVLWLHLFYELAHTAALLIMVLRLFKRCALSCNSLR